MRDYADLADAVAAIDPRTERPFRCHVHGDHQASASVNVVKGLWVCYTCGAKGKVDGTTIVTDTKQLRNDIFALLEDAPPRPHEAMLDLYTAEPCEYWRSRFTDDAIEHFRLGRDPDTGYPVYPIWDSAGDYLGVVQRRDTQPKYKYPEGIKLHNELYNYRPVRMTTVVLVEGAMDVVAAYEAGVTAFGIYGARLNKAQADKVARCAPKRVILAFDNDTAGDRCAAQAVDVLPEWVQIDVFPWKYAPTAKDLGDLTIEQRTKIFQKVF